MKLHVTPEMAKEWLLKSTGNFRRLDRGRVRRYINSMRAGSWQYNGESIKLNCNGSVVDGQHRLVAVVESGISITTEVIEGISDISEVDTGKPRSLSDLLKSRGHLNANNLSSALKLLHYYRMHKVVEYSGNPVSNVEILKLMDSCPSMADAVKIGCSMSGHKWLKRSSSMVLIYCTRRADKEMSDRFVAEVNDGSGLKQNDPTFVLREYFRRAFELPAHVRPDSTQTFAVSIKAWNYFVRDKPVAGLKFTRTGQTAEAFPRIMGFEEFSPE